MTDQLHAMIEAITNALDDCETVLGAGFSPPGTLSWVIPPSRHAKNVLVVLAEAHAALRLTGHR